jgi:two-component system NarL family sensor kinase
MRFLKWFTCTIFLLFFLYLNLLKAQPESYRRAFEHNRDSFTVVLKKFPKDDTSRVWALYNIVDCATFLSEKKEMLPLWSETMQLSRKLNFKPTIAACLQWRGSYYKSAKKYDSAFIYYDSTLQMAGASSIQWLQRLKGFTFFQKGMIYETQDNLYPALQYYFESWKSYGSVDFTKQKMIAIRIASIYRDLGNDDKAIDYYQQALQLYKKASGKYASNEADGIYTAISTIYYDRGDLQNASYYLQKMAPAMPDTEETIVSGSYYYLAGKIALKENKTDSAIYLMQQALKYFRYTSQVHSAELANVNTDISRIKIQTGDMAAAKVFAEAGLADARQSGIKLTIANALDGMAAYYHITGNQAMAFQALHESKMLSDTVLQEANIKQANRLSAIYENSKKGKEISQLQSDKKNQEITVQKKSQLNIIFVSALVLLLLFVFFMWRNLRNKQMLQAQQQQIQHQIITDLEKEKQLMAVESMLKGQEEERSRLAKDLHDGLGGMLSGVKISFSNMKENMIMDAGNVSAFEKAIAQLDSTIVELRKVSHNLMPEAVLKFGLKSALKDFCDAIQRPGKTRIICEQFGEERELGNNGDVNVYRIIQELVNNAVKHADARQILVQLTKTPNKVLITVEDNGKGFNMNSPASEPGIGFPNLKYRVNYLNGIMEIHSQPGDGTTVNIELAV